MTQWNNTAYQKISDVRLTKNNIVVSFENKDIIEIPKEALIPVNIKDVAWEKISFNPFEIVIPAIPYSLEIPWDKIRVIADKKFGKHLAERAEEQSKLIGEKLKSLRERKGFKSGELAERAGLTPQTISRIEKGHTDVSFSTLRKILASMGYSLKDLANQEIEYDMKAESKSLNSLIRRLGKVGIDSNLLTKKIIPLKIQNVLNNKIENQPVLLLDEAVKYISTIFGWTSKELWSNNELNLESKLAKVAYFKKPSKVNEQRIIAYSHYAYYLAKVVLKTFDHKRKTEYPKSLDEFKSKYLKAHKTIDFESLLDFVWNIGICVLPLNDLGIFHGASWNIEGRHVIVLKQNTDAHARWIFDLLHELYHVFLHLEEVNTSVIEVEELTPFTNNESIEELEANSFANQFIFGTRAEEIADKCVSQAQWEIKNLKSAVKQVAKQERIREDFIANYLAFRLNYQDENWWGTATKLQVLEPKPFMIATEFLKKKIKIEKLSPIDFNLLNSAITN